MGKTMNKEQAFGHLASKYTKWPDPDGTLPTASHRGWYWVKLYKSGDMSMVFQSLEDSITEFEFARWRTTPPPTSAPAPNYRNPDDALQWCVNNITMWPHLNNIAPQAPDCWEWSSKLSPTHKSLALLNDCGAVMAVIAYTDWVKAKGGIPKSDPSQWVSNKVNPIMKFFEFEHLPKHLQQVSESICLIARAYDESLPDGPEKSAGLRKLLEAKDCFVRAAL
jgi:hypothetical protein